jgi:hypothetical protein
MPSLDKPSNAREMKRLPALWGGAVIHTILPDHQLWPSIDQQYLLEHLMSCQLYEWLKHDQNTQLTPSQWGTCGAAHGPRNVGSCSSRLSPCPPCKSGVYLSYSLAHLAVPYGCQQVHTTKENDNKQTNKPTNAQLRVWQPRRAAIVLHKLLGLYNTVGSVRPRRDTQRLCSILSHKVLHATSPQQLLHRQQSTAAWNFKEALHHHKLSR